MTTLSPFWRRFVKREAYSDIRPPGSPLIRTVASALVTESAVRTAPVKTANDRIPTLPTPDYQFQDSVARIFRWNSQNFPARGEFVTPRDSMPSPTAPGSPDGRDAPRTAGHPAG